MKPLQSICNLTPSRHVVAKLLAALTVVASGSLYSTPVRAQYVARTRANLIPTVPEAEKDVVTDLRQDHATETAIVSPDELAKLERLVAEMFPELLDIRGFDPAQHLWVNGLERPQTSAEVDQMIDSMLLFVSSNLRGMPTDFEAFSAWLVSNGTNDPGVDYEGMNQDKGDVYTSDTGWYLKDNGDGKYLMGHESQVFPNAYIGDLGDSVFVYHLRTGDVSVISWESFLTGNAVAFGIDVEEGELSEVNAASEEDAATTLGDHLDGIWEKVGDAWDELVGRDTFDLAMDSLGDWLYDDTEADSGTGTEEPAEPTEQPLEPELDEMTLLLLAVFPPISKDTLDQYQSIDELSRYWSDKTPTPIDEGSFIGNWIEQWTGIDPVDKPESDLYKDQPAWSLPSDGVTDPIEH